MSSKTRVELLAPARDLEVGVAAIDSGADAVYLGAPRFGARARVGNSLADIAALVEHAHTFWARVYVTVNTLLHDDELPQAVQLIQQLYEIGVDAVIVVFTEEAQPYFRVYKDAEPIYSDTIGIPAGIDPDSDWVLKEIVRNRIDAPLITLGMNRDYLEMLGEDLPFVEF